MNSPIDYPKHVCSGEDGCPNSIEEEQDKTGCISSDGRLSRARAYLHRVVARAEPCTAVIASGDEKRREPQFCHGCQRYESEEKRMEMCFDERRRLGHGAREE